MMPAGPLSTCPHLHSSGTSMLTKIEPPRTKRELVTALEKSQPKRFEVFEGTSLKRVPSIRELEKGNASVIVLRF